MLRLFPVIAALFGQQPGEGKDSCADVGVLGAMAGTMGCLQATEVIKELLDIGESLSGWLLLYEALGAGFHKVKVKADPACPLCGPQASISDVNRVDYRADQPFCAAE